MEIKMNFFLKGRSFKTSKKEQFNFLEGLLFSYLFIRNPEEL